MNDSINQNNGKEKKEKLKKITDLPYEFQNIFNGFQHFNIIQTKLFDILLDQDSCVVVSAPTGSGKTVLFELAIIRCLIEWKKNNERNEKIVYMAPVKALCSEKMSDWKNRFSSHGINILEITGDTTEKMSLEIIQGYNLILTTPEKWDSMTRRWRDNSSCIQGIKLFLIDEVHLLNDDKRGPTLEAVVSRMKTVQNPGENIRFVAVSATIPNIEDFSAWLSFNDRQAQFYKFGEEYRPVTLKKIVIGYPFKDSSFKFDLNLNYRLKQVIRDYSQGKPSLIFCSTRKGVMQTSGILKQELAYHFTPEQTKILENSSENILDNKLREMIKYGLAYHHAGLTSSDRNQIEELFRSGSLPILVSTSTLAMGVNLPAHLVIIKSTEHYVGGKWIEYSEGQLLQMIGRAGRPQYDTNATAIIMTKDKLKDKYERLTSGKETVESSLHKNLVEFLNSEIVLGTVTDVAVAMQWIRSTFLYIRALKNPMHYGIPSGLNKREIEAKLQALCLRELNALEKYGLVATSDFAYNITPTENGKVMARNYIAFESMKVFMKLEGNENIRELLDHICNCQEYQEVQLRVNEKTTLNLLNKNKLQDTIRFPINGKIKTKQNKVNCLIQAVLGCLQIQDPSLNRESSEILRVTERLLKGLTQYLWQSQHFQALHSSLLLYKCVICKLWENSPYLTKQLPGIGTALSSMLASASKTTFKSILDSNPRDLERVELILLNILLFCIQIINRQPPMGNQLQEAASKFPQYYIHMMAKTSQKHIEICIGIANSDDVRYGNILHKSTLLISTSDNVLIKKEKLCDQAILAQGGEFKINIHIANLKEIIAFMISETIVGIDVKAKLNILTNECTQEDPFGSADLKQVARKTKNKKSTKKVEKKSLLDYKFLPKKSLSSLQKIENSKKLNQENVETMNNIKKLEENMEIDGFSEEFNLNDIVQPVEMLEMKNKLDKKDENEKTDWMDDFDFDIPVEIEVIPDILSQDVFTEDKSKENHDTSLDNCFQILDNNSSDNSRISDQTVIIDGVALNQNGIKISEILKNSDSQNGFDIDELLSLSGNSQNESETSKNDEENNQAKRSLDVSKLDQKVQNGLLYFSSKGQEYQEFKKNMFIQIFKPVSRSNSSPISPPKELKKPRIDQCQTIESKSINFENNISNSQESINSKYFQNNSPVQNSPINLPSNHDQMEFFFEDFPSESKINPCDKNDDKFVYFENVQTLRRPIFEEPQNLKKPIKRSIFYAPQNVKQKIDQSTYLQNEKTLKRPIFFESQSVMQKDDNESIYFKNIKTSKRPIFCETQTVMQKDHNESICFQNIETPKKRIFCESQTVMQKDDNESIYFQNIKTPTRPIFFESQNVKQKDDNESIYFQNIETPKRTFLYEPQNLKQNDDNESYYSQEVKTPKTFYESQNVIRKNDNQSNYFQNVKTPKSSIFYESQNVKQKCDLSNYFENVKTSKRSIFDESQNFRQKDAQRPLFEPQNVFEENKVSPRSQSSGYVSQSQSLFFQNYSNKINSNVGNFVTENRPLFIKNYSGIREKNEQNFETNTSSVCGSQAFEKRFSEQNFDHKPIKTFDNKNKNVRSHPEVNLQEKPLFRDLSRFKFENLNTKSDFQLIHTELPKSTVFTNNPKSVNVSTNLSSLLPRRSHNVFNWEKRPTQQNNENDPEYLNSFGYYQKC